MHGGIVLAHGGIVLARVGSMLCERCGACYANGTVSTAVLA